MKPMHAVLFVTVAATAAGCAIRGRGKNVAYVVDGGAIVAGAATIVHARQELERNDCEPGPDPYTGGVCFVHDTANASAAMVVTAIGLAAIAAGVTGMMVNHLINIDADSNPAAEQPTAEAAGAVTATATPARDECSRWIADWQAESHPVARELIRRDMGSRCRARLDRLTAAR